MMCVWELAEPHTYRRGISHTERIIERERELFQK